MNGQGSGKYTSKCNCKTANTLTISFCRPTQLRGRAGASCPFGRLPGSPGSPPGNLQNPGYFYFFDLCILWNLSSLLFMQSSFVFLYICSSSCITFSPSLVFSFFSRLVMWAMEGYLAPLCSEFKLTLFQISRKYLFWVNLGSGKEGHLVTNLAFFVWRN